MNLDNPKRFFEAKMPRTNSYFPPEKGSLVRTIPSSLEDIQPLNPKQNYSFVGVVPNPVARKALEDARITRGGMYEERPVLFDATLLERYVDFVEKRLKGLKIKHLSYPLVDGTRDYPTLTVAHPHVFLMPERKVEILDKILSQFNYDDVFDKMKKREAPQNYYLEPILLLHVKRILPLVRAPEVSGTFTGKELKTLVDLLLPFRYKEPHDCSSVVDCD